jgi:hypothetical protein
LNDPALLIYFAPRVVFNLPPLGVLDPPRRPLHPFPRPSVGRVYRFKGIRVNPVHADMEVHVVGVLVEGIDGLALRQIHLVEGDLYGLQNLSPLRGFIFFPAQKQMHYGVSAALVLKRYGFHLCGGSIHGDEVETIGERDFFTLYPAL